MRILSICLLIGLVGCGPRGFRDFNQLGNLRILSLQADHPEVSPGATVTIKPLVSDLNGKGRSLTYSVEACSDIAAAALAVRRPDCQGASDRTVVTSASGATNSFTVDVPLHLLDGLSKADQMNGVKYRVVYIVTASDGTIETGVKHLVVSNNPVKNSNPNLISIQASGAPLVTLPTQVSALSVQLSPDSAESYSVLTSGGSLLPKIEVMTTTWFISDGSEDIYRSTDAEVVNWTPPAVAPADRKVVIIAVTRDGRGGESYVQVGL